MSANSITPTFTESPPQGLRECSICSTPLPLRCPRPGEGAIDWVCVQCDAIYHAVLIDDCDQILRRRVHPVAFRILEEELPEPKSELLEFAQRLSVMDGRRQLPDSLRRALSVPVMVMPLNEDLCPVGNSFMSVSRSITSSGMVLTSEVLVETKFLAVQLPKIGERSLQLAMKIVRQRPIGHYYEIAGLFVTRMYV